jgi:iron complex transport system ATP-binding protein
VEIFILAGGKSSRMGTEKWQLPLGNKNFLERITETARTLKVPVQAIFEDNAPGNGPLGGVQTAFENHRFSAGLFLSCDMPLITEELLKKIIAVHQSTGGAVFSESTEGFGFPFLLPRTAGPLVAKQIKIHRLSLQELAMELRAETVRAAKGSPALLNVNTPSDYRLVLQLWSEDRKSAAVLEVRNLTIRRGTTELLTGFSWKAGHGEHWVVLGANGCGKTSLFSSLLGYLTPTRGDIFVLGEEYGNSDWPELRKKIGLVSSSVRQMMPDAEPAWITVASGKYAMIDFWGTPKKSDRSTALGILHTVEAEHIADRPWAVLSQGERQRVLIGRALMAKPALLILDEPCAGLDPAAREHFLQFIERLGRSKGSPTLVLVTHHVEEIMPVFTHVMLMKAGGKIAEGPLKQVLTSARISETFNAPIQLGTHSGRYYLRIGASTQLRKEGARRRARARG